MAHNLVNGLITPDGTYIESRHRHDFVRHTDTNGKVYCVDGGLDYRRYVGDIKDCQIINITTDHPHSTIREYFRWGSYGKDGTADLKLIKLKDMEEGHIGNLISYLIKRKMDYLVPVFKKELEYRKFYNKED